MYRIVITEYADAFGNIHDIFPTDHYDEYDTYEEAEEALDELGQEGYFGHIEEI